MFFTKLPREVIYHILLEAVRVRGTKRAQRLRFVSRAWKDAVDEAIVRLGEFASWPDDWPYLLCDWDHEGRQEFERAPYWPEYVVRAVLIHPPPGNPYTPRLIRHVAEAVARHRYPITYSDDMLKEYILEICKMTLALYEERIHFMSLWYWPFERSPPEERNSELYYAYLLCAAAWTKQVGLVEETLQSMPRDFYA
ncbi:uncharacterized protein PG986_015139 [Apiospora aurea]|uniref:F-box domain-containing protein n=1 Tax=Apiospora aurea TaxID=335848 RepID=A0ABR1PS07_9PEZI